MFTGAVKFFDGTNRRIIIRRSEIFVIHFYFSIKLSLLFQFDAQANQCCHLSKYAFDYIQILSNNFHKIEGGQFIHTTFRLKKPVFLR